MMEWEEDKKAKAFVRLHDGVCQSLAAIMYLLRSTQRVAAGRSHLLSERIPEPIIPSLQAVIQDARAVALQLRPPRMQEAGLLATLNSLWVDSRALNPALVIKPRALVEERDIPDGLKPVILRIAQMTLDFAAQNPSARRVAWVLERSGQGLQLSIDMAVDAHAIAATVAAAAEPFGNGAQSLGGDSSSGGRSRAEAPSVSAMSPGAGQ